MNKKTFLVIVLGLIFSAGIVFGIPQFFNSNKTIKANYESDSSIISQNVISYGDKEKTYNKLYASGKLIGYINDYSYIEKAIAEQYKKYEKDFPNSELGLNSDVYVTSESSFGEYENIDDKIVDYLIEHKLLGVKTTAVEFSTAEGVYDIIYVKNIDDFYAARDKFLLNFVSEETLSTLRAGNAIKDIDDYGTIEKNLKIQETIKYEETIVSPEDIYMNQDEIYEYLCYGRDTVKTYYETVEGDTLFGIGYNNGNMSPKQIVMLNPGVLSSTDQILTAGMKINVTYYSSPITVVVTKNRLAAEEIIPESPEYREDSSIVAGAVQVITEEENGSKNVLYEEKWINGVLQSGEVVSSVITRQPVRGVMAIGTKRIANIGTGNFIWPTDNPIVTCGWEGYVGHNGTDIANMYNAWGKIYAADDGVVIKKSYDGISGNYCVIDHQNGYWTYYGHMNVPPYVEVGDNVVRGQVIGQIGMTGLATGPHIHFMIYVNSTIVNVCTIMDCDTIPWQR